MALTVNTNNASINALNNLNKTNRMLGSSMSRISSGLRIATAADDAAGLGVANNLETQNSSSVVARRNVNDGLNILNTGEGATNEVVNLLQRMRELAVQGASDTLASTEKGYLQTEGDALLAEIGRISSTLDFNGIGIGTGTTLQVQVGADSGDSIGVTFGDISTGTLITGTLVFSTTAGATNAITQIDAALDTLQGYLTDYGAAAGRLDSALNSLDSYTENLSAGESAIRDADFAMETASMARFQIMQQAGLSVLAQANQMNQGVIQLIG